MIKTAVIKKVKTGALRLAGVLVLFFVVASPSLAHALADPGTGAGSTSNNKSRQAPTVTDKQIQEKLNKNPIVKDLNTIVNFLSAGVAIIVVAVIVVGGIQYVIAGDNPQAVSAAKQRILNALIALLAFLFMYAFLQWLIPGGVFR